MDGLKNQIEKDHEDFVECYTRSIKGKVSSTKRAKEKLVSIIINQKGINESNLVTNNNNHIIKKVEKGIELDAGSRGRYNRIKKHLK